MMQGPMLQAILEDRFKLVLHRETRQRPVYALTPVRGDARLRRFREGSCVPLNPENSGPPPALPPGRRYCENMAFPEGPNLRMVAEGTTLEDFALAFLSGVFVDRPVVDRTGLTGRFDIDLVFARTLPGSVAPAPDGAGPTIYTAIQEQLGLRLEPTTGPAAFIVIDRVERPTEN